MYSLNYSFVIILGGCWKAEPLLKFCQVSDCESALKSCSKSSRLLLGWHVSTEPLHRVFAAFELTYVHKKNPLIICQTKERVFRLHCCKCFVVLWSGSSNPKPDSHIVQARSSNYSQVSLAILDGRN